MDCSGRRKNRILSMHQFPSGEQRDHPVNLPFFLYFSALFFFSALFLSTVLMFSVPFRQFLLLPFSVLVCLPIQLIFFCFSCLCLISAVRRIPVSRVPGNHQSRSGHLPASDKCQVHILQNDRTLPHHPSKSDGSVFLQIPVPDDVSAFSILPAPT